MIDNQWLQLYRKRMEDNLFVAAHAGVIQKIAAAMDETRFAGGTIYVAGNGGSAAMANHFAIDVNKVANELSTTRSFRCVSLASNASELTAWANDDCFSDVFTAQLSVLAKPGDLVILISASGTSPNIVNAGRWCWERKIKSVLLSSEMKLEAEIALADIKLLVKDTHYGRIEDTHMFVLHFLCYAFKEGAWKS